MAIVAEGKRQRIYLPPSEAHIHAAQVAPPAESVEGEIADNPRWFSPPAYGLTQFTDLFTNRQLVALTTFSDLVTEARERVLKDAMASGLFEGDRLEAGGQGAAAYADAVATYLGFVVARLTSTNSALCRWNSAVSKESVSDTFGRQALPMVWDFAEGNVFCTGPCDLAWSAGWVSRVLDNVPTAPAGDAVQQDAASSAFGAALVSTDPPYYDNIGYSDLSDFFYVWHRRMLRDIHPGLLSTLLVPKAEELVANPYRHNGKEGAREFFEKGFRHVFAAARESASSDFPITVYYAFKQSESQEGVDASTGWQTLLEGVIRSGWAITATWPVHSERGGRMISVGTNALASAIVLALRPRPDRAPTTDRRGLIAALQVELPQALRDLQQGLIAPVDLPQAAIGPGMAVFSRYAKVIEADGSPMTVRSALARINEILDQVLNEQEGDFDGSTRFAIAWYGQHGYGTGKFGDADNLARARNTAVEAMDRDGILTSRAGRLTLLKPADLSASYDVLSDEHVGAWEALHHLVRILESDGVQAAGEFLRAAQTRPQGAADADLVKELAFLLFSIAEKNGWTRDALSFNTIATSWAEVVDASRVERGEDRQGMLEFGEE
jgi:putative DNA methylase